MKKKLLIYGGAAVAMLLIALVTITVFAEKVGVAEIVVQKDVVLDEATLQKALEHSADCAGFKITEVRPVGEGKVLARITGMHGACCIGPAKSALTRIAGVKRVEVMLFRKSEL